MRKQRRLEESQNAREIDPGTAAVDDVTLDMIDEELQRVKRKRNQYARPKNRDTIPEHYGRGDKKNTIRAFPNEFGDRTSRSIDQALRQWSEDFSSKVLSKAYSPHRAPAYGNIIDLLLLAEVKGGMVAGLRMDDTSLRLLLVRLLEENDKSYLLIENNGKFSFAHGFGRHFVAFGSSISSFLGG